jgi:UDP-perosamine 4-acetyltransferase
VTDKTARKLLVLGAGGHARVVIDVARAAGFDPVAALDPASHGANCNGVKVIGGDDMAQRLFGDGLRHCAIAVGDNRVRARLGEQLAAIGYEFPVLIHPSAIISPSAQIGDGTVIMPLAVVNASATIGRLAIVNTSAVVEHDCRIGDAAHVAPGCRLGGTVTVGTGTLIGIGSVVRPEAQIGDFATIGAGATVVGDIAANQTAMGSPAKVRPA